MDVNARHRPRTCTSTHARTCQNRLNSVHSCPPASSTHLWNNRFSWHCIEPFLAVVFLLVIVYDGDNIGLRQERWPALMTTTRCSARSKTSWQRLRRSMWSNSFAMRSSQKVASRSALGCSDARRWTKWCWAALKSLQRLTLENPYMTAQVERWSQRRGQVHVHRPLFADG